MKKQTRKHYKKNKHKCITYAKKGTLLKCRLKTCKTKKYQAIYGAVTGGSPRENIQLFY